MTIRLLALTCSPMADLKQRARVIRRDVHALYLASRDPRVPWYAKAMAVVIAGYVLSPIALGPDFIPVLGYLDDLVLIPLGVALVVKLVPTDVMLSARARAAEAVERPTSRVAAACIVVIWVALSIVFVRWVLHATRG